MRLLTWNIQAGIGASRYRDYVLRAHLQLVHARSKTAALHEIGKQIAPYDVVCLQEVDLGGRRAGYRSQVDEIAARSGHPYVAVQENRRIPGISRHGNAILSRSPLADIQDVKLPGLVKGRGCLVADVQGAAALRVICLHLSLGASDQSLQLARVAQALRGANAWAVLGDFNCAAASAPLSAFRQSVGAHLHLLAPPTYPAWRPARDLDHIVTGGRLSVTRYRCETVNFSDHLPVSAHITL